MRGLLLRLMPVLRLTRVTKGFAAAGNLWFVVLWTRNVPPEADRAAPGAADLPVASAPLWLLLAGATVCGMGLYAYGAVLNDLMDVNRDRALRRDRPLASGALPAEMAAAASAATLIAAVLGAAVFGTSGVLLTVLLAGAILLFNLAGKFIPAVGLLLLALIYAAQMFTANTGLRFVWPVWLAMTHALALAGLVYALERKSPRLSLRAASFAAAGWLAVTLALLWIGRARAGDATHPAAWWPDWIEPVAVVGPAALVVAFVVVVIRRLRKIGPSPRAAEKINRYGAMWMPLYGAAWLAGVGAFSAAAVMIGLVLAALLGTAILRESYGLAEQPIGFRR